MRYVVAAAVVLLLASQGLSAQTAPAQDARRVYDPGNGISNPDPISQPSPKYTDQALRARIAGEVWLEAIVEPDGTVKTVSVKKSLDQVYGLDEQAMVAARQWRFLPARTRDGTPVPVKVVIIIEFRPGAQLTDESFRQGTVSEGLPGFAHAVAVQETEAKYTSDAMRAKLQGNVEIDAVVSNEGRVLRTRVTNSLDRRFGLDEEAEIAVRQWRFQPATVNGIAVASVAHVSVPFKLH